MGSPLGRGRKTGYGGQSAVSPRPPLELRLAPGHLLLPSQRSFFSSKKEEEAKAEEPAAEVTEAEAALQGRIAELEEKHAEVFDKYRRSLADFENLRNRMNKQVADAKLFGIQGFCKVATTSTNTTTTTSTTFTTCSRRDQVLQQEMEG